MSAPNLSELATVAFESVTGELADNVLHNIPFLREINKAGKVKPFDGGEYIRHEFIYDENGTYTRYNGWEEINISPLNTISAARYAIKQIAVSVSINGLEELQAAGKAQLIDLLEGRIESMKATYYNNMSIDLLSTGTASGGKQIGGLQSIVADAPSSGVVGGVDAATWSFWRNYSYDSLSDGGANASSSNIESYMTQVLLNVTRNEDRPDLILADNNYWKHYHDSLTSIQRIAMDSSKKGSKYGSGYGTGSLEFSADIPVMLGGGLGGACPENHMYFLNLKHLMLRPHTKRNMTTLGEDRYSTNQDGFVRLVGWAGNLTCGNRQLQGVLKE